MRLKIGLIFSYNEQWIGGTYYIINLIHAINLLDGSQKPELIIFSNRRDFDYLKSQVNYPYLSLDILDENPLNQFGLLLNKVWSRIFRKKLVARRFRGQIDGIFPFEKNNYFNNVPLEKQIYWIPDFQDKQLPQFFTQDDLKKRDSRNSKIAYQSYKLLLSSKAVLEDLKTFYPKYKTNVQVVHFAVTHPTFENLDIQKLKIHYQLPDSYFFAPNQFWAHKNQITIIKAVELLKQKGRNVVVAFSGKENDNRNPDYFPSLKKYVIENNLTDNIRFLGFLDREVQLQLMNHSMAIIQPSLFEGWSTVIEDSMAMNKRIIASDLEVNIEQLGNKGIYFERIKHQDLASKIEYVIDNPSEISYDYLSKQISFAKEFIKIFN